MNNEQQPARFSHRGMIPSAAAIGGMAFAGVPVPAGVQGGALDKPIVQRGRILQSVSRWCYNQIPFPEFARTCAQMGLAGIDLLGPGDFATLKEHGLVCTMTNSHSLTEGLNRRENHARCLDALRNAIEATAAAGFPNVITFSGNRGPGIDDEEGAVNCVEALKQIAGFAEEKKVTLCMELLNSKRDHKGYMCDRTAWGVEVCKAVGSPRVKLLYDIYHMQIQEGDVIATMREFREYIAHAHTGGVPGRGNLDDTQELHYAAIMQAIAEMRFSGYVAHEFVPRGEPLAALAHAVKLCDV